MAPSAKYHQVNVFISPEAPLSGNGAGVVDRMMPAEQMQLVAAELKQYETTFLRKVSEGKYEARIFTKRQELDFAGHPILGTAASLHFQHASLDEKKTWTLVLKNMSVTIVTQKKGAQYQATMDQGTAMFSSPISSQLKDKIIKFSGLHADDIAPFPIQIVSTGLPYLIIPLKANRLQKVKLDSKVFPKLVAESKAELTYFIDTTTFEARSLENDGSDEDIATGSAAGPAAAYLFHHKVTNKNNIEILQGRFVGKPSRLQTELSQNGTAIKVKVSGLCHILLSGELFI